MVEVTILGKTYKVKCVQGEEQALKDSIALLKQEINATKDHGRVTLREDVILMAALNLSHKYLKQISNNIEEGE